ncbi:MAG: hypothetical protein ACE5D7_00855 [Fidelibacterota bacterium]
MNWFLPLSLMMSLSVRTPYVQPNPYDYEVSIATERRTETLTVYTNKQWERELGEYYSDDHLKVSFDYKALTLINEYLYKESRSINYNRSEVRIGYDGFNIGYSVNTVDWEHLAVAGYNINKNVNLLFFKGKANLSMSIYSDENYSGIANVRFGLLQNVDLNFGVIAEKYKQSRYLQGKVSIDLEIPS